MAKRGRKPQKPPRKKPEAGFKGRISPQLKQAIELIVQEGKTLADAAQAVGLKKESLQKSLKKPHVAQFKTRVFSVFKDGLAEASLSRVSELAMTAKSESVRLDANKTLMGLDERFQPTSKVKHQHSGNVTQTPGYVIDLTDDTGQGAENSAPEKTLH